MIPASRWYLWSVDEKGNKVHRVDGPFKTRERAEKELAVARGFWRQDLRAGRRPCLRPALFEEAMTAEKVELTAAQAMAVGILVQSGVEVEQAERMVRAVE